MDILVTLGKLDSFSLVQITRTKATKVTQGSLEQWKVVLHFHFTSQ